MSINLMSTIFQTEFRDLQDAEGQTTKASTAKIVLLAMADNANDEGEGIYPSIESLAKKCALSEQTIRNTFDALLFNGIIYRVGVSKHGTHNHTINTAAFPKIENKRTYLPLILESEGVKPVEGQMSTEKGSNEYLKGVKPVDPNHHITIKETYCADALSKSDLQEIRQSANKKVDAIIAMQKEHEAGKSWRGRELLPTNYLPYADWWNAKTNLEMYGAKGKPKVNTEWLSSCKELYENEVTLEACEKAYAVESWDGKRQIVKLAQIVSAAKAIQATMQAKDNEPVKEYKDNEYPESW